MLRGVGGAACEGRSYPDKFSLFDYTALFVYFDRLMYTAETAANRIAFLISPLTVPVAIATHTRTNFLGFLVVHRRTGLFVAIALEIVNNHVLDSVLHTGNPSPSFIAQVKQDGISRSLHGSLDGSR
jgi:hypothetical protein